MLRPALTILGALGVLACGGPSAERGTTSTSSSPVADTELVASTAFAPRAYANATGVTLSLVYLQSPNGQPRQALGRFTGMQHPLEGKMVHLREREVSGTERLWQVRYDGRLRTLMAEKINSASHNAQVITTIWLPGMTVSTFLQYDAEASKAIAADEFLAAHRGHLKDGSLRALETLDRPKHEAKVEHRIALVTKNVDRACGTKVEVEVDWESISDDELAIGAPCHDPLEAYRHICERDAASRASLLRQIKKTRCTVDDAFGFRLEGDVLHLSVANGDKSRELQFYEELHDTLGLTNTVLQNEAGQLLVLDPEAKRTFKSFNYYLGNEQVVHRLPGGLGASEVWNPRGNTSLAQSKNGYTATCKTGQKIEFLPVSDEKRIRILAKLRYEKEKWKRRAFALARDDRGTYYYVDHYSEDLGGKNFRVFKGARGQVRPTALVDIVDDSSSMIFATKKGKLRFLVNKEDERKNVRGDDALWIEGKKRLPLALVPIDDNLELIYHDLGAYDGENFGLICD